MDGWVVTRAEEWVVDRAKEWEPKWLIELRNGRLVAGGVLGGEQLGNG